MTEFNLETSHTAAFWDERCAAHEAVWGGRANQRLVEQATGLVPGAALNLGCGAGGDAVWPAQQEWNVPTADQIAAVMDARDWRVEVAEVLVRPTTDHDGNAIVIHDSIVRAVRT
jgi:hypothetical protein